MTTSLGVPRSTTLQAVFARWDELVGEGIAARARPASLRDGTLVVTVDEPGWATQLRWLESELLERLSTVVGVGEVVALDVRVARG